MRNVFAAWVAVRGSCNIPEQHLSADDWKEWRAHETSRQRDERRLREAIARTRSWGRHCFNMFVSRRKALQRTLRIKLAVLRKARAVTGWRRVQGQVTSIIARVRVAARAARRHVRLSVLFGSVLSAMREEAKAAAAQAPARIAPRQASVNLTRAVAMGPVLSDLLLEPRPLGDG